MRPGILTTEFWGGKGAQGMLLFLALESADLSVRLVAVIGIAVIEIVYSLGRAVEKLAQPAPPTR